MRITLDQCVRDRRLNHVPAGQYGVEYTDSTHLKPDEWVQLGILDVRPAAFRSEDETAEQYYTFLKSIGDLPEKPSGDGNTKAGAEHDRRLRTIEDVLALALGRAGLLSPEIPTDLLQELLDLDAQDGVVIVPDTNALYNGAVHWLLRVLRRPSIWLMPVVASLTTIQTRDATIKSLVNKSNITNTGQALRSRGLVNGALGLLERNKGRCQVVEIDPSLLRYQKMASGSGSDPDQSDVLEDRLIIEAIHGVLRSMRSRAARRVVTSDVNVARVLNAEGVVTLFVPSITLGESPIDCLRYDALARGFIGAPLSALLWEITHVFGSIRMVQNGSAVATLHCYWPGKSPAEWASETLWCTLPVCSEVQVTGSDGSSALGDEPSEADGSSKPASHASIEPNAAGGSAITEANEGEPDRDAPAARVGKEPRKTGGQRSSAPITTALPRASLLQVFRLLAAARRLKCGSAEEIVSALTEDRISVDKARRPLEILRRVQLLNQTDGLFSPTGDVDLVERALSAWDLDSLSTIMQRFEPYRAFLASLQEQGQVARREVVQLVMRLIGPVGTAESERLPRFLILLGQAWSSGDMIVDGSRRPTDRDAADAFEAAFASVATEGIAKVSDLLPRFCEATRMSPWAAKRQLEGLVAARMLPAYSFEPAAGAKPITRDEVISGTLDKVTVAPVVIDRLHLGERPVFTIEGPAR